MDVIEYFQNHPLSVLVALYVVFKVYQYATQKPYDDSIGPEKIQNIVEWNQLQKSAADKVIVVDFYATWCGPCKVAAPHYFKLSQDPEFSNVIFRKCNVNGAEDVAKVCGIRAMPTFKVYYGATEVAVITGYNEEKLKDIIRTTMKSK
jgi:thioredoxin 1